MGLIDGAIEAIGGLINQTVTLDTGARALIVGSIVSLGEKDNAANPFFFTEFEVPSTLQFGTQQISATHNFIGGGRAVDLFGAQPKPITVSGRLFNLRADPARIHDGRQRHEAGVTAMERMQRLRQMCNNGNKMLFQYHQFKFYCVVLEADFDAQHWDDVNYTIKLEVIDDSSLDQGLVLTPARLAVLNPSATLNLFNQFLDLVNGMTSLLNKAALLIDLATLVIEAIKKDPAGMLWAGARMVPGGAEVLNLIAAAQNAVRALGNLRDSVWPQTMFDMTNAQPYETLDNSSMQEVVRPSLSATKKELDTAMVFFNEYMPQVEAANPSKPAIRKDYALLALMSHDARVASSTLGKMDKEIDKIIVPLRSYRKTFTNPNLAKIALQEYGDASMWPMLADANGFSSVTPPAGTYQIVIPYRDQLEGSVTSSISSLPAGGI